MGLFKKWFGGKYKDGGLVETPEPDVDPQIAEENIASIVFLINPEGEVTLDIHIDDKDAEIATEMLAKLIVTVCDGPVLQQSINVVKGNLKARELDELFDSFTTAVVTYGAQKATEKHYEDSATDKPCAIPSESTP